MGRYMTFGLELLILMLPGVLVAGLIFVWVKTSSDGDRERR
jgi:hypothetical protein